MTSAPSLHAHKRFSAVEACRLIAGEVWRQERKLEDLRTGGLNSEKAVRQRLQSIAMAMQRAPDLEEKVALHLHSIDWLDADPLTILERTEGLLDRQCRDSYPSIDALLRDPSRATQLALRLLVIQGIAGRLGRWAVRAGEIPDARIARKQYRDLGTPEWSQFCRLTDDANAAFDRADYATAAAKAFDADRLVRTPAGLLMAAIALSRLADFIGALWTIRVCLLEPEESFESSAALRKARTLEARLRDIVENRMPLPAVPVEAEPLDRASDDAVAVDEVDIVEEQKHILETKQAAELRGEAVPPERPRSDRWNERYLDSDAERAQKVLVTPKPVFIDNTLRPVPMRRAETRKGVVTLQEPAERQIQTQQSSAEHVRLVERERVIYEARLFDPPLSTELESAAGPAQRLVTGTFPVELPTHGEEVTFIPPAPSIAPRADDFADETEIPPDPELRRLRERAMLGDPKKVEAAARAISAAAGLRLEQLAPRGHDDLLEPPTIHDASLAPRKINGSMRFGGSLGETARPQARATTNVTERIIRRVVPANQPEARTEVVVPMAVPMGQHTRETTLAALDREERALSLSAAEETTAQIRAPLKRVYEVTQIVRARNVPILDPEIELKTEQLPSRSPFER